MVRLGPSPHHVRALIHRNGRPTSKRFLFMLENNGFYGSAAPRSRVRYFYTKAGISIIHASNRRSDSRSFFWFSNLCYSCYLCKWSTYEQKILVYVENNSFSGSAASRSRVRYFYTKAGLSIIHFFYSLKFVLFEDILHCSAETRSGNVTCLRGKYPTL